jgi:hypothetical protein
MRNIFARTALVIVCCGTTLGWAQTDGSGGGDYHGRNNINENDKGRGAVPGKTDPMATDSVASVHIGAKNKPKHSASSKKAATKHHSSSSSAH